MKSVKHMLLSTVLVLGLSGCGSECTEDDLKNKLQQVAVKVQALATSGDVTKLMEFSQKASRISQSTQGDSDLQAACQAADDLLDEL